MIYTAKPYLKYKPGIHTAETIGKWKKFGTHGVIGRTATSVAEFLLILSGIVLIPCLMAFL